MIISLVLVGARRQVGDVGLVGMEVGADEAIRIGDRESCRISMVLSDAAHVGAGLTKGELYSDGHRFLGAGIVLRDREARKFMATLVEMVLQMCLARPVRHVAYASFGP